jgi:hypothetical protein
MMGAVSTSETPVNFYEATQRHITEDFHIQGKNINKCSVVVYNLLM